MERPKTLTLSKKKSIWNKNRGSSRVSTRDDPREIIFYVRCFKPMFFSGKKSLNRRWTYILKIEIRNFFLKIPDFAPLKHLIFIILWYQSSPSRSKAELLTMKRRFEKNGAAKDFDFKQKKSIWNKNRGSSRVEGSGLQLGMIPYFLTPREVPHYVRYFKPMFVSGK